jgi:hypothetical protein
MGKYEDDAKIEFFGLVGLCITIICIILFSKC